MRLRINRRALGGTVGKVKAVVAAEAVAVTAAATVTKGRGLFRDPSTGTCITDSTPLT